MPSVIATREALADIFDMLARNPRLGRPVASATGMHRLVTPFGAASYVMHYRYVTDDDGLQVLRLRHVLADGKQPIRLHERENPTRQAQAFHLAHQQLQLDTLAAREGDISHQATNVGKQGISFLQKVLYRIRRAVEQLDGLPVDIVAIRVRRGKIDQARRHEQRLGHQTLDADLDRLTRRCLVQRCPVDPVRRIIIERHPGQVRQERAQLLATGDHPLPGFVQPEIIVVAQLMTRGCHRLRDAPSRTPLQERRMLQDAETQTTLQRIILRRALAMSTPERLPADRLARLGHREGTRQIA